MIHPVGFKHHQTVYTANQNTILIDMVNLALLIDWLIINHALIIVYEGQL